MNLEWALIFILILIITLLSFTIYYVAKKATYLPKEKKELIIFVIDMYIEYGEEINITSKDKHELVVSKLNQIKDKLSK